MRALKRLSHRDWLTLRDLWLAHLPAIDFESVYPGPTLWELSALQHPQLDPSGIADCPYVPGVREAVFREAVLLTRKFIYCGTLLPTLSKVGRNTWTAVAAYEASFYGAKALCYLLGFASLGRNSNLYLDAFFETKRKEGKIKVSVYETCRVHKFDSRLTHEVLWALTERVIDTTTFPENLREIHEQLRILNWEKFTNVRNNIIYDGAFWPLSADMTLCDLTKGVPHSEMTSAASLADFSSAAPFAGEYFAVARLFRNLIVGMFETIADIAPAVASEVQAFNALRPAA